MKEEKNISKNHVWKFTNQRKLSKKEFETYIERKVFRTIRKFSMLSSNPSTHKNFDSKNQQDTSRSTNETNIISIKKSDDLNTKVLKTILETKFKISFSSKPNFSNENASDIAEITLQNILKGKFFAPSPTKKTKKPLYFLTDKEIKLYAKLKNIKGKSKKRDPKIQELTQKFIDKNQDLEINILKALEQINKI